MAIDYSENLISELKTVIVNTCLYAGDWWLSSVSNFITDSNHFSERLKCGSVEEKRKGRTYFKEHCALCITLCRRLWSSSKIQIKIT